MELTFGPERGQLFAGAGVRETRLVSQFLGGLMPGKPKKQGTRAKKYCSNMISNKSRQYVFFAAAAVAAVAVPAHAEDAELPSLDRFLTASERYAPSNQEARAVAKQRAAQGTQAVDRDSCRRSRRPRATRAISTTSWLGSRTVLAAFTPRRSRLKTNSMRRSPSTRPCST